jgi:hypothetical protein
MQSDPVIGEHNRPLTASERNLARWMLEHGTPEATGFLPQLERASATTWRCKCGCASFNLRIEGLPVAPPGVNTLADFVFGSDDDLKGIFIYEKAGILKGVELVGYGCNAPATLPDVSDLRPVATYNERVRNRPKPGNVP